MNNCHCLMVVVIFGMLCVQSVSVQAQTVGDQDSATNAQPDGMMEIVNEAINLFQAGNYRIAIEKFEQAYGMVADPNILFNIARCRHLLGEKEGAIEYYNRFIADPNVPDDNKARAQKYLSDLTREKPAEVSPATNPDGPPQPVEPTAEPEKKLDEPVIAPSTTPSDTLSADYRRSRMTGWTLFGTGAAIAVGGGILGGVALANHNQFESSNDLDEKESLENKGKALALAGDICLGVGIVTAAVGVVLLLVKGKAKKHASQTTVHPLTGQASDGFNASLSLHF